MPDHAAIRLPDTPTLVVGVSRAVWLSSDGEIEEMDRREAAGRVRDDAPPMLCHGPAVARRLGIDPFPALDLLELFESINIYAVFWYFMRRGCSLPGFGFTGK